MKSTNKVEFKVAGIDDFKVGTVLFDSEGNKHRINKKYMDGIWETEQKVVFESEARFYTVERK